MTLATTCLGCRRDVPLGRSWCRDCAPRKAPIPGYRQYRRVRAAVLAEERVCSLCGRLGTPAEPLTTVDHVLARANGGTHARGNLRAAHRSCNSAKGAGAPCVTGLRVR